MNRPHPWPLISAIGFAALLATSPATAAPDAADRPAPLFLDRFQERLQEGWTIEREDRADWRLGASGLEVHIRPGNMWGGANNARNVFVRDLPDPNAAPVEISMTVSNRPTAQWEQANLVWYYDQSNMVKLGQELVTERHSIVMGREQDDRTRTVAIIPLDANAVELRLQAFRQRVRGQFRTAASPVWRDAGECDLPIKGAPKASLQCYNGPANEVHWVSVVDFAVRRIARAEGDWTQVRVEEKTWRPDSSGEHEGAALSLPGAFRLLASGRAGSAADAKDEQRLFRHRDGSYGWSWERVSPLRVEPSVAGVGLGLASLRPEVALSQFPSVPVSRIDRLELAAEVVTRLESDHGDHNLAVVLVLQPHAEVSIEFDWYGPASAVASLQDGNRTYGRVRAAPASGEYRYRIQGFRGLPPRVNLQAMLNDAVRQGLSRESELIGIWLGNELWNGSRGSTLVTRLDLFVNEARYSSRPGE